MIKKVLSTTRFISINLVVLFILLFLVNILSSYILKWTREPSRAELPNYIDHKEMAKKVFSEYGQQVFGYESFTGWRNKPYAARYTHVNENGMRYYPNAYVADSTYKKVRFFGGSTMWGEGSPDSLTIPAIFQAKNPSVQVYNHGQLAYNSRQNVEVLINLINKGEEVGDVIFYDGVNDVSFLCPSDVPVPGHRLAPIFDKKIYGGMKAVAFEIFNKLFLDKTLLLIQKINPPDYDEQYNCDDNPEKVQAIVDFMIGNWKLAHELVTNRGGQFTAVLQPIAYVGNPKVEHLKLGKELGENVQLVYDALITRIKKENLDWIYIMTDAFDKDEYIYVDFCHVSPNGNQIIADRIQSVIKP